MTDDFRPARVARFEPEAQDQAILSLEHDAVLEAAHTRPGQYCQVAVEGVADKSYFVLIDPPRVGPLRFLLRGGAGAVADTLLRAPPGAPIAVRGPLGRGFPVEAAQGRDVLLVSAGSGLAAIRPVLMSLLPYSARRVWLFHGARSMSHVPFGADLAWAERHGARVVVALSRTDDIPAGARRGRVQDVLSAEAPDLTNAVCFVAGMEELIESLRVQLPRLRLSAENLFLNY